MRSQAQERRHPFRGRRRSSVPDLNHALDDLIEPADQLLRAFSDDTIACVVLGSPKVQVLQGLRD